MSLATVSVGAAMARARRNHLLKQAGHTHKSFGSMHNCHATNVNKMISGEQSNISLAQSFADLVGERLPALFPEGLYDKPRRAKPKRVLTPKKPKLNRSV